MKTIRQIILAFYRVLLGLLPRHWVAEMLRIAGERLDVRSCACAGGLGIYEARLSDRGVLGYYLVHHTWEPGIQKLLSQLAAPEKGAFIDVGANVGLTLIPLGMRYPKLQAFGVEADEENFGYLMRNVARNGIKGATLFHRAVHSCAGELEFERSRRNAGDHRVRLGQPGPGGDLYGEGDRSVVRVKCDRLDALIDPNALPERVGLKVDIQGAEVHFMAGAEPILALADWLVIEFWPYGIIRAGSRPEEFFSRLQAHFPYGGIIETKKDSLPRLMPISELSILAAEQLGREAKTAHLELLFAKSPDPISTGNH